MVGVTSTATIIIVTITIVIINIITDTIIINDWQRVAWRPGSGSAQFCDPRLHHSAVSTVASYHPTTTTTTTTTTNTITPTTPSNTTTTCTAAVECWKVVCVAV